MIVVIEDGVNLFLFGCTVHSTSASVIEAN